VVSPSLFLFFNAKFNPEETKRSNVGEGMPRFWSYLIDDQCELTKILRYKPSLEKPSACKCSVLAQARGREGVVGMNRLYKPHISIIGVALFLLMLASCSREGKGTRPVVRVHLGESRGMETLSYTMRVSIADHVNGLFAESPGIRVAFKFGDGNIISRLDIPGSYFIDGQPRILLTDRARRRSVVLFRNGLRLDTTLDPNDLSDILFGHSYELGFFDLERPFQRWSAQEFVKRMRAAAFDVVESNNRRIVVARVFFDPQGGEHKFALAFDEELGAVVEATEEASMPDFQYKAETKIDYIGKTLDDGSEVVIPYEIDTSISGRLKNNQALPTVELPRADEVLSENEEIQLGEGEYVAEEFMSMPGEGTIDPNYQAQKIKVRMDEIRINHESEDYFLLGKW